MLHLQKSFDEQIKKAPKLLLSQLVEQKLKAQGASYTPEIIEALAGHLLKGRSGKIRLDIPELKNEDEISLQFTEEDFKWLEKKTNKMLDAMPETVMAIVKDSSSTLLRSLKRRLPEELDWQDVEMTDFKVRLYNRWGKAIDLLRMMETIARDFGSENLKSASKAKESPVMWKIITLLHIRACQVTNEIICLLVNGYADGAMARWRTLHELSITLAFIAQHGENLAQRYRDHEIVESYSAMKQYKAYSNILGGAPVTKDDEEELLSAYTAIIERYGKSFGRRYGWAAEIIGNPDPTFQQIEAAIDFDIVRPYYKFASYNVHATPKGISIRLGAVDGNTLAIAGASNAGIEEAGIRTALSFLHANVMLVSKEANLDKLVIGHILSQVSQEAQAAFSKAAQRLDRDEQKIRRHEARLKKKRITKRRRKTSP